MNKAWNTTIKPSFSEGLRALPDKDQLHILRKLAILEVDPTPDGHTKKKLKHLDQKLHRLRCGDYRVIYTYEAPFVSLLAIDKRDEDTYDNNKYEAEILGGLAPDISLEEQTQPSQQHWEQFLAPQQSVAEPLPNPITTDLLTRLTIPKQYHAQFKQISTEDELLNCTNVPQKLVQLVIEALYPPTIAEIQQQPDYILPNGVDDLLRIKDGELIPFLLKLSPEQEKYVSWSLNSKGPTLVKGGPGTGKSTIALYRVRALLAELRKHGQSQPCILLTTYTNALVHSSEQLLEQLLGEDIARVEVLTADKLVMRVLGDTGMSIQILKEATLQRLLTQAIAQTAFDGAPEQQLTQQQTIARMSLGYLQDEFDKIIVSRQISTLKEYLSAPRTGRKMRFTPLQRRAIWAIYATLRQLLSQQHDLSWSQARAMAAQAIAESRLAAAYDAVIIDEAQDLEPSVLNLLVQLCKQPNRLFLTADANQSIYGSGFSWSDVHSDLHFQGRTAVLHTNYRSTREIGTAAQSYLAGGALDTEPVEHLYVHQGPQPAVRRVANSLEQTQLLVNFIQQTHHHFHLSRGSCAVLCPTNKAGQAVAADLTSQGIPAVFMTSTEVDLKRPEVKVLTIRAAKGLEFPIVTLAGFVESTWHSQTPTGLDREETEELLAVDRRAVFVGMTRAMRALLVVIPDWAKNPLLSGFSERYWNLGD